MDQQLATLIKELEDFGDTNDARNKEYAMRMLNITHEVGEFLLLLVRGLKARRVLEVGTSNGYSTLWLAYAVQPFGGRVTTLEHSDYKIGLAQKNFYRAGLEQWIDLRAGDAADFLRARTDDEFDFIFLDSDRKQYPGWWQDLDRILKPGGVLVADNMLTHTAEIAPLLKIVREDARYLSSVVPLGNGEFVALKDSAILAKVAK